MEQIRYCRGRESGGGAKPQTLEGLGNTQKGQDQGAGHRLQQQ
jgi:hypothetical protein